MSKKIVCSLLVCAQVTALASLPGMAETQQVMCRPATENTPVMINAQCVDPDFAHPVIDREENLSHPVNLRHVSGHFAGTTVTFNFYFPDKSRWAGRFFHHLYPYTDGIPDDETLRFGAESGAYIVQTGASSGYRADASAARFSREVARDFYGVKNKHIFGYVYGGSGGSYQTIAAIENSQDVWDGAVPYVIGVPTSIPTNFFARAFARLVLNDVAEEISDAMLPGGSQNPYEKLNPVQREVLREITRLGVPLRGWDNPDYLLGLQSDDGLMGFQTNVKMLDPDYASDFWSKPGYLGTEDSALGDYMRAARVLETIKIVQPSQRAGVLTLERRPSAKFTQGAQYTLLDQRGRVLGQATGYQDGAEWQIRVTSVTPERIADRLKEVASVRFDNSWPLALTTYHRHQIPHAAGFHSWDQFRLADGTPRYPQRPGELGLLISRGASGGGTFTGHYAGKMILLDNLLDMDAYPWQGDWYAQRVRAEYGDRYSEKFRIWINDNADHHDGSVIVSGRADHENVRLVSYVGILQQALRDVSAWVEQETAPAKSTDYRVVDGQVVLNADPARRNGIQPVVHLTVEGGKRAELLPGESTALKAEINVPAGAGTITRIEWSPTGKAHDFRSMAYAQKGDRMEVTSPDFTYNTRGVYFPVIRITLHRGGDKDSVAAAVQNIDRVRLTVR